MIGLLEAWNTINHRRWAVVVGFVLLAILYMLATPIWEASDELSHFAVVDYIARTSKLPYQDPAVRTGWQQEGSQPPLYYMLVALLVAPIDTDEPQQVYNPHAKIGIGLASDNQNLVMHDPEKEAFPWHGAILAVMVGRLFSIALGAGTVWLSFAVGRLTVPQYPQVALLAMVLTAFNPMFLFITASVNNDNLVIFLGTSILVVILKLWRMGWQWGQIGLLALLLALAALTKLSGLTFVPVVGLTTLLVHWRERRAWRDLFLAGGLYMAALFVIAGWWYWRNIDLYSDPTGLNVMVDIAGHRPAGFNLGDLWAEREGFYFAYWGWFGGLNVLSPSGFFNLTYLVVGAGCVGFGLYLLREKLSAWSERIPVLVLLLQILIVFVGVVRWTMQTPASQGRLLFSAIVAISTILALGLVTLSRLLWRSFIWRAALAGLLVGYAVILPVVTIRPAYRPPDTVVTLPLSVHQVDVRYGAIRLLGYEIDNEPLEVSEDFTKAVSVTLYWQPEAQTAQPLSFYVEVFAPSMREGTVLVGKLNSYPGRGLRQTDTWEINRIYRETYHIVLESAHDFAPFEPRFKIGWRDHVTDTEIAPIAADGTALEAVVVRGGRVWSKCEFGDGEVDVRWGNLAQLRGIAVQARSIVPGGTFEVVLQWNAIGETRDSLHVFVQLIDPLQPNVLVGSGDAVPLQDWWPTYAWVKGGCFEDRYTVQVEAAAQPGSYAILIGLYDPLTGRRLPVSVRKGERTPFPDAYLIDSAVAIVPGE